MSVSAQSSGPEFVYPRVTVKGRSYTLSDRNTFHAAADFFVSLQEGLQSRHATEVAEDVSKVRRARQFSTLARPFPLCLPSLFRPRHVCASVFPRAPRGIMRLARSISAQSPEICQQTEEKTSLSSRALHPAPEGQRADANLAFSPHDRTKYRYAYRHGSGQTRVADS